MSIDSLRRVDLNVDGMSCASCASGIERHLSELGAVSDVQVNFATGRATVFHDGSIAVNTLEAEVEGLGYGVIEDGAEEQAEADREADLRRRLIFAAVLAVPAMIIGMVPALRFNGFEWLIAAMTTPVILWSGWPLSLIHI